MIPHDWNLSATEAIALQKSLAEQVDTTTPIDIENLKLVAGVDVSVKNDISRAAIIIMTFPELELVEAVTAQAPTPFPYIAGLLSFREGGVILAAHEKLTITPDVYIFDGQGLIHPRRIGIASHMGLWFNRPTIGCGKTPFVGKHALLATEKGAQENIVDKGEVIGRAVRTRDNVKPVYISVGHLATLDTACDLIMQCTPRYRLPEPIRAAHNTAGDFVP